MQLLFEGGPSPVPVYVAHFKVSLLQYLVSGWQVFADMSAFSMGSHDNLLATNGITRFSMQRRLPHRNPFHLSAVSNLQHLLTSQSGIHIFPLWAAIIRESLAGL